MKLIKTGAVGNWWVGMQRKCSYCHSVVEFEKDDVVKEYKTEEVGAVVYFNCPLCGKESRMYYAAYGIT